MKVKVSVNESGTIRNGRYAFADRMTLVRELLQNARRAGATQVDVTYDDTAKSLIVQDDGRGIENWQALLSFNESGWDATVIERERAFGMGFSKVLYAATSVTVTSNGKVLAFDSADALAQAELEVLPCAGPVVRGTTVQLNGVDLAHLDRSIQRMVRGFPTPVRFNGLFVERRHATDQLTFVEVDDVGQIYIAGAETGVLSSSTAVYLQGLLIGDRADNYFCDSGHVDVVHLDATRFLARAPDRTELIDAEVQRPVIRAAIKQVWKDVLAAHKATMPAEVFADMYFEAAVRNDCVDIFDDVPVIPRRACLEVTDYPMLSDTTECMTHPRHHVTKEQVESGAVSVATFDPSACEDENFLFATLLYARAAGLLLLERLGDGHWARRGIRDLNAESPQAVPCGDAREGQLEAIYAWSPVVLCDHVEITHGAHTVKIDDDALFHDSRILIPRNCESGDVVRQVSTYMDDGSRFDDTAAQADCQTLERLVRTLRCDDAPSLLASLLRDVPFERYSSLAGKTFKVTLDTASADPKVEEVS
jgi:hypothetical protein